ncbi:MAG: S-layer homology domain-containing protein, partial [Faecousia sp.]
VCNEVLVAQQTVSAEGHKLTETAEKAPTCTEAGNIAYWTCSVCQKTFSDEAGEKEIPLADTVLAAAGHSYGDWQTVVQPTCTTNGKQERVCTVCGEKEEDAVPAFACPSALMTDVIKTQWYHDSVDYMMECGLMYGTSDTTFEPEETLTRSQFVTVLYRIAGEPEVTGELPFTDVPEGQWFSAPVLWAAQEGVVQGVSKTSFAPDAPVTREQIAAILYRYTKAEAVEENKLSQFPDAGDVSTYAVDAMNWAVSNGLIRGSDGKLLPQDSATRAQIAAVMMRWLEGE